MFTIKQAFEEHYGAVCTVKSSAGRPLCIIMDMANKCTVKVGGRTPRLREWTHGPAL